MTVAALTASISNVENGATLSFAVPFRFLTGALTVTRVLASGSVATLTLGVDYSVSGGTTDAGGTVTLVGSVAGATLRIRRATARNQAMNYATGDTFPAESHEAALDRAMMIDQEQDATAAANAARAVMVPDGETAPQLPSVANRKNKFLAFTALGAAFMSAGTGADAGLREDLAGPNGADLIMVRAEDDGAIDRALLDKLLQDGEWADDYGAIMDGTVHTLAEWVPSRFANLAAIQVEYPHAVSLSETIDKIAIQAAVNASIYGGSILQIGSKKPVRLPAGHAKIDGPIHLGYGTGFSSVHVEGAGLAYAGAAAFGGTTITLTANVGMVFAVHGTRHSSIKGMTLIGQNKTYLESGGHGASTGPQNDLVAANWVDPALPAAASARFTPYAGIAFDPNCGTAPGVPYPTINHPAFLGSVNQYGKNASTGLTVEDVNIEGFVVAIAAKPCNADGNAEYVKVIRPVIRFCQYAFSIGHTQSRLFEVYGGSIASVYAGITTATHGLQQGKGSIAFYGTEIGACIKWMDIPTMTLGGPPMFISCYGESVYSIGNAGTSAASNGPIALKNCEIQFGLQEFRGAPKYVFEWRGSNGTVSFENCRFTGAAGRYYGFYSGTFDAVPYRFTGCSFADPDETVRYRMFAKNSTGGVFVNRMAVDFTEFDITLTGYNLDTGAAVANYRIGDDNPGDRRFCLPAATRVALPSAAKNDEGANIRLTAMAMAKTNTPTAVGRIITWDTGLTTEAEIVQRGLGVGCTIFDEQSEVMFIVKARTAYVLTLEAMSGFDNSGNLLTAITGSGAMWCLNALVYTPTQPLFLDTTDGNAVATNVSNGRGVATFITADIVVNDYVLHIPFGANYLGDEAALKITARDAGARTITVAGVWKRTAAFRRVPALLRAEAPNG